MALNMSNKFKFKGTNALVSNIPVKLKQIFHNVLGLNLMHYPWLVIATKPTSMVRKTKNITGFPISKKKRV